jgi:hypothetical protein
MTLGLRRERDRIGMLPPFNEHGYLPPGIHPCHLDEVVARFGSGSSERVVEAKELVSFVAWARSAGVRRLILNGSFVTAKAAPNDVDVVILPGPGYPRDQRSAGSEETLWPFLQVFVAADEADLEAWALRDFGTDRQQRKKRVVEVVL